MAKFMFLAHSGEACEVERSPEEMQKGMEAWCAWMEKGRDEGWLLDPGDSLKPEVRRIQPDGTVTDGPFAESKELIGGYSMVEASDLDAAVALAQSMPVTGVTIEVRELSGHSMD